MEVGMGRTIDDIEVTVVIHCEYWIQCEVLQMRHTIIVIAIVLFIKIILNFLVCIQI